ncbi:MAG: DUF4040 domain-containing protein [Longimicrobiales bacterium]
METVVDITLLALLAVAGLAILRTRNLFSAVMLAGIYSLVAAALFTTLDAVDVAFTEAAVGAGISTVLFLGTLALVGWEEKKPAHRPLLPLVVVLITGAALVYGTADLPPFGAADNPVHDSDVARRYIEESPHEIGVPNMVTSVLASYRGYDTMGETTVIFAALVGVLLLIARGPRPRRVWDPDRKEWLTRWDDPQSDGGDGAGTSQGGAHG